MDELKDSLTRVHFPCSRKGCKCDKIIKKEIEFILGLFTRSEPEIDVEALERITYIYMAGLAGGMACAEGWSERNQKKLETVNREMVEAIAKNAKKILRIKGKVR